MKQRASTDLCDRPFKKPCITTPPDTVAKIPGVQRRGYLGFTAFACNVCLCCHAPVGKKRSRCASCLAQEEAFLGSITINERDELVFNDITDGTNRHGIPPDELIRGLSDAKARSEVFSFYRQIKSDRSISGKHPFSICLTQNDATCKRIIDTIENGFYLDPKSGVHEGQQPDKAVIYEQVCYSISEVGKKSFKNGKEKLWIWGSRVFENFFPKIKNDDWQKMYSLVSPHSSYECSNETTSKKDILEDKSSPIEIDKENQNENQKSVINDMESLTIDNVADVDNDFQKNVAQPPSIVAVAEEWDQQCKQKAEKEDIPIPQDYSVVCEDEDDEEKTKEVTSKEAMRSCEDNDRPITPDNIEMTPSQLMKLTQNIPGNVLGMDNKQSNAPVDTDKTPPVNQTDIMETNQNQKSPFSSPVLTAGKDCGPVPRISGCFEDPAHDVLDTTPAINLEILANDMESPKQDFLMDILFKVIHHKTHSFPRIIQSYLENYIFNNGGYNPKQLERVLRTWLPDSMSSASMDECFKYHHESLTVVA